MKKQSRRKFIVNSVLGAVGVTAGLTTLTSKEPVAGTSQQVSGKTYTFTRKVPVEDGYDVIVAGGGPSGAVAAISAGRLGARVLLVEGTGCMGGMGTSGLVTTFNSMSDGVRCIVGGVMLEIVETLYKRKQLGYDVTPDYWQKMNPIWMPFQAEGLKLLLDELVVQAGVEVRFFTRVIDADADAKKGQVNGLILNNIEGHRYVQAKTFIDCTGDAVLSKLCGVDCREAGHDTPMPMAPSLDSLHANIDWKTMSQSKIGELFHKALADGHFTQPDKPGGMFRVGQTVGQLNAGHIFKLDALRCKDLSEGIMHGRRIAQEYFTFYRKYVPGCENIELVSTASLMGIRESRRIVGEYELKTEDYQARRQFPDQIGVFNNFVDIHPYNVSGSAFNKSRETDTIKQIGTGECFGIPYGIIVPKGWRNLWVAGRCNSSDVNVHAAIRVQPAAAMMGQAAGTAAVQSIQTAQPANDLNTEQLVKTLREKGAYLPQKQLSSKMTLS